VVNRLRAASTLGPWRARAVGRGRPAHREPTGRSPPSSPAAAGTVNGRRPQMIRWCAHCQRYQGDVEPLDDYSVTHTICEDCVARGADQRRGAGADCVRIDRRRAAPPRGRPRCARWSSSAGGRSTAGPRCPRALRWSRATTPTRCSSSRLARALRR